MLKHKCANMTIVYDLYGVEARDCFNTEQEHRIVVQDTQHNYSLHE